MNKKYFGLSDLLACLRSFFKNDIVMFEKEFSEYLGIRYAVATSYGRTALYLGLKALGAENKEVIIPALTCTVVRQAVVHAGAVPRFVDIELPTFDFSLDDLRRKISSKTCAIVITHYFGNAANNMEEIIELGKEKGIAIIEDCAHSLGGEYKGKKLGSYGDFSIFSLTKGYVNFGGGVLVTNNESIFLKCREIINQDKVGIKKKIVDFPLLLSYGIEQLIDKAIFDRIGRSIFKWWAMSIPKFIVKTRYGLIMMMLGLLGFFRKTDNSGEMAHDTVIPVEERGEKNPYYIGIDRITASVGRRQVKKIDYFVDRRKEICTILNSNANCVFSVKNNDIKKVHTNILLNYKNSDLGKIIEYCKKEGLLLRGTWPTHQHLCDEQKTRNVDKIKNEILTWNVNPMVKEHEVKRFLDIINNAPWR